ncbi:MAG: hypothetical protein QXK32_11665 [Candidatus Jordarchaeales archaeon]
MSEVVSQIRSECEFEEFRDPLLKLKGVTPEFAALLKEAGYYTVESIATEVPHFLFQRIGEKMGFSLDKAEALIRDARSKLDIRIMSAKELYEEELRRKTIPTGSRALDEILGGGIRTQEITEVCGSYACGKTELVYTTSVLAPKALGGDVLILDTEATLSVTRIRQIAKARELDPDEAISPIHLRRVPSSSDLIATLETAHKFIKEKGIRYLAIDSFVSPFRREYPGRELLCPRQQKLNYAIGLLITEAELRHRPSNKIGKGLRHGCPRHKPGSGNPSSPVHNEAGVSEAAYRRLRHGLRSQQPHIPARNRQAQRQHSHANRLKLPSTTEQNHKDN